jgi:hypothetical protein
LKFWGSPGVLVILRVLDQLEDEVNLFGINLLGNLLQGAVECFSEVSNLGVWLPNAVFGPANVIDHIAGGVHG